MKKSEDKEHENVEEAKNGKFYLFFVFLFVALVTTIGLNANYAWAQEGEGEDESAGEDKKVEEDLDIDLDMKKMGIGLKYKRETLEKVKSPPDKIDNLSAGGTLNIMSGDNMSSMMYGGVFGWQRLNPSGNFPGIEGGKRHCFSNELFALLLLGQIKSEVETMDADASTGTKKEEKTTSMTMIGGMYSPCGFT